MKPKPLSYAKITPPKFSDIFLRKKLFSVIDKARSYPIVWISAPPGSGKTTLISSYMESRKLHCLWYQVDNGDAELSTFFYYMRLAAKKTSPNIRKELPLCTPEYLLGLPTFAMHYFENLYDRLPRPSCIVFDDYQAVASEAALHGIITDGLTIIPKDINVIFISREDPPPALARLRASNVMKVIGWDELILTPGESLGIVKIITKKNKKISKKTAEVIYNKSAGWAAGLVLILDKAKKDNIENIEDITIDTIFDYFDSEMLGKLDADSKDFLIKTSLLPAMDSHMAERLTDISNAGQILSNLHKNNCFTERRQHSSAMYQYHPLFREFLLSKVKTSFTHENISLLQKKAAAILEDAGRCEDAFSLLCKLKDWERTTKLILNLAKSLVAQGRGKVLENWIISLPQGILESNPWLLYWYGICRMPFNLNESRTSLKQAYDSFKAKGNVAGLYLSWAAIIETFVYEWSDFKPVDYWIQEIMELLRVYPELPSPEIEARVTLGVFCALMYRQPQHPDMRYWEERTQKLLFSHEDIRLKIAIGSHLMHYYTWWIGDAAKASLVLDALRPVAGSANTTPLSLIAMNSIEAIYYRQIGKHDKCLRAVNDGLNIAKTRGIHLWDFMLYAQGVCSALICGNVSEAQKYLEDMGKTLNNKYRMHAAHYHFLAAWLALYSDNSATALEHAQRAVDLITATGTPFFEAVGNFALADVLIEQKKYEKALTCLAITQKIAHDIKSKSIEYQGLVREAYYFIKRQDKPKALETISRLLDITKEYGFINYTWWRPTVMLQIYMKALESGIETEYVQKLIKIHNLSPLDPPVHIENWPWAVKVFTLGRFSFARDGKQIKFTRKAQQKPLAMLKALIAFGGREVTHEQLTDALWPDTDGDRAHKAFTITLHRLRQLIGMEKAINLRGGCISLDARYWWVDIWTFERILSQADAAVKIGRKETAIHLIEKAVSMYHGHFLAGDEKSAWAISTREKLRSKFLRYISELGRLYEEKGDLVMAIGSFKKGIEVDMISEKFYQHLMICYQKLGRQAEALTTYNRLKNILSAILGIAPSHQTEAIYKTFASK